MCSTGSFSGAQRSKRIDYVLIYAQPSNGVSTTITIRVAWAQRFSLSSTVTPLTMCPKMPVLNRRATARFHGTKSRRCGTMKLPLFHRLAVQPILASGGQRPGEVTEARFEEFDRDARLWTLPPERTKNKRYHLVRLTELALAILPGPRRATASPEQEHAAGGPGLLSGLRTAAVDTQGLATNCQDADGRGRDPKIHSRPSAEPCPCGCIHEARWHLAGC